MKILLIYNKFYGYENYIIDSLRKEGHELFLYKDSLSEKDFTWLDRVRGRIDRQHYKRQYDRYFEKMMDEIGHEKIDRVILIFGAVYFTPEMVDRLRSAFKEAKFIYYMWDSFANYPKVKDFYQKFDICYSFDHVDAEKYGMRFLPLFTPPLAKSTECDIEYDYCTIMTYRSGKGDIYRAIKKALPSGLRGYEHIYIKRRIHYLKYRKRYPEVFGGTKMKDFKFKLLRPEKTYEIMAKSKAVIVCHIANQDGLGFGTYEALGLKRKVITTIEVIKNYDFYTPDNIFVIDENTKTIPKSFFDTPFNEAYSLSEKYSLDSFVDQLLSY